MLILTIRTDSPEAEIGIYEDNIQIAYQTWQAHRQLAETLHAKITELLAGHEKSLHDVQGIVSFQGPGSFTGLRIGLTVANALAQSVPAAHVGSMGDSWQQEGIIKLLNQEDDKLVLPEYGAEVHITLPKH